MAEHGAEEAEIGEARAGAEEIRLPLEQCVEAQYGKRDGLPPGNGQHQASLIESLEQTIKMTPRAR